ncbi:MAG: DUF1176 domain-containing protein, partial [Pseudomonadota bacterium]
NFGFRRAAGPDAPVQLVLATRDPLRSGSDIAFSVDGEEIFSQPIGAFNYRAAIYEYTYRAQEDVALLLDAARRGAELQITHVTRAGQSTVPFSLSGMVAGSIFMDEVQGRVGRTDSILKLGAKPATAPIGASASLEQINSVDELPRGVAIAFSAPAGRCYNPFDEDQAQALRGFKVKISDEADLYGIPCGGGGAYNQLIAFWAASGNFVAPLALPSINKGQPIAMMDAFNASYDPEKRELTSFYKGRGLGDCGTYHRWSVSDFDIGNLFRLEEMRNKEDCDGVYKEDLSDYEQLWPQN